MCLSINNWDNFITYIKYFYYSNERKHSLKWLKNCNAIITNACDQCDQNDETVLNVSKCYEEGDVVSIRQIDDFRSHIITFTKDEAIALKTYLDSVIPTMISK
ncbi:Phage protein [Yersinia phage fPS-90]|uniref:Phage protein n=1 Tax=Yersinia phage fPS-90 TaxID=2052932 RepID=A0A449C3M8_9CAUD|nr:Phage protein [Yersinia phage fPS-90]VEV88946.1 Phage protein [Yersinia phage fPS-90]